MYICKEVLMIYRMGWEYSDGLVKGLFCVMGRLGRLVNQS